MKSDRTGVAGHVMRQGVLRRGCLAVVLSAAMSLPIPASRAAEKPIELNFATYAGPTWAGSKASEWWAKEIEKRTNGRVKINFFYAQALLSVRDTIRGVGDRRADIGVTSVAYHPSELPLSQISNIPFVTSNGETTMKAMGYLYENNKQLHDEFTNRNVHVLYYQALGQTPIGAKQKIPNLEWLKGKKIRAIGYTGKALDALGASPVAITYPELYESMQRDVVSAYTTVAFSAITDIKLQEVAPYVVDAGIGEYGMVVVVINKDLWDSFPKDIRDVFEAANQEHTAKLLEQMSKVESDVCSNINSSGGSVTAFSEDDIRSWKKLIGNSITDMYLSDLKKRNIANGQEFLNQYEAKVHELQKSASYEPGLSKCAEVQ